MGARFCARRTPSSRNTDSPNKVRQCTRVRLSLFDHIPWALNHAVKRRDNTRAHLNLLAIFFGFLGILRGLVPTMYRDGAYVAGMLALTPMLQDYLMKEHAVAQSTAGLVASIIGRWRLVCQCHAHFYLFLKQFV